MALKATFLSDDEWLKDKGKLSNVLATRDSWPTVDISNLLANSAAFKAQDVVSAVVLQLASLVPASVKKDDLSVQVHTPKRSFYLVEQEDVDELKQILVDQPTDSLSLIARTSPFVAVASALEHLNEAPDSPAIKKLMFNMRFQLQVSKQSSDHHKKKTLKKKKKKKGRPLCRGVYRQGRHAQAPQSHFKLDGKHPGPWQRKRKRKRSE